MKRWLFKSIAALLVLAVAGFLIAASGLVPIKASSGHWAITTWFLRFGMHRSFATHSLGVDVPRLDEPHLVLKGATHYEIGCRSCHGSPGTRAPRIGQSMTPPAPDLIPLIAHWKPEQLFSVVKHGVKFTGMPAWPEQQRDDEVWAMVAFLRKLPELDAADYRRLTLGDLPPTAAIQTLASPETTPRASTALTQSCIRCHGDDGLGRGSPAFPKLAGQQREYLENALLAYANGQRHSGIMGPIAAALDAETMRILAGYYSRLPRSERIAESPPPLSNPEELGRRIAQEGLPERRIPACVECHGPSGRRTKPSYPLLAGQPADYLVLQLELFKAGHRGGSPHAHLMDHVAPQLEPEEMRAVARYFESLPLGGKTPR